MTAHDVFSYNIILVQHNHTFYEHFSLAACISFTILAKPLVSLLNLAINTAYVEPFSTVFAITPHHGSPIIGGSAVAVNIYVYQNSSPNSELL